MEADFRKEMNARIDATHARVEQVLVEHKMETQSQFEALQQEMRVGFTRVNGELAKLNTKIDAVAEGLNTKIDAVAEGLNTKIDAVAEGLNTKIDAVATRLDAKIDTVATRLDAKIDTVSGRLDLKIDAVNLKMDDQFSRLFNEMSVMRTQVDARLEQSIANMAKWVVGIGIALITMIVTLMAFMLNNALGRYTAPVTAAPQAQAGARAAEPPLQVMVIVVAAT